MLVQSARRRARPDTIRHRPFHDQLCLPWLSSTFNASRIKRRRFVADAGPQAGGPRRRRNSQDASSVPPRRALATATGYMPMDDIPFEGLRGMPPPTPSGSAYGLGESDSMHGYQPYRSQPLYLGGSITMPPMKYARNVKGIGGDLSEIHSVFDACLQVGRIERAGVILQRISQIDGIDAVDLVKLHNRYLRAAVEKVMTSPGDSALQELHKWFELHIRLPGLPQDTETVAYMVKASLQSPAGKRERLVRRYMDLLNEDSALQLLDAQVLTAQEIHETTQIYPKYNFVMETEEELHKLDTVEAAQDQLESKIPTPSVKPTGQKGLGLKSLKKSLSLFTTLPYEGIDLSTASEEMKREIQQRLEKNAVESAIDRWRDESTHLSKMGLNTSLQTKSLGARMWKWQTVFEQYLKDEIAKVDAAENITAEKINKKMLPEDLDRVIYGPFLRLLPPDKLAAVTILSVMTTLSSMGLDKGITLSNAILAIAKSVEDECVFDNIQKASRKNIWPNGKNRPDIGQLKRATRFRTSNAARPLINLDQSETAEALADRQWPLAMRAKVGAFLMSAIIEIAKVPVALTHPETGEIVTQMQPAFFHAHQYKMGKKVGIVMANKSLVSTLKREPVHSLLAKHLPMLVEPEPWSDFSKGGFLAHPSKIMRIKAGDKDQRYYAEAAIGQGDMTLTFKGLNVLGKTSWRINQQVFEVMLEAWNTGDAIANIPPENPNLKVPPEPEASQDPLERRQWIRAVKNVENHRSGLHSQRCFQNFQLEIARALKHEEFYFPHNVDFRGRAYPIPPYLNHMGADHCRGLLMFGKGRELGESGLRWLKIHAANVFGFDKASLSEREAFALKHMDQMFEAAKNPLGGTRWWLNAEDPWQFLAACMELKNAMESPDPTRFVSNLPVHQDGTCNGLQHYAALGGDTWGAKQVNLEPGDRPADVYTAVADLVKEGIAEDLANGNQMAMILEGKVTRKVVKQTVMTNVYGVTYIGAKAQVRRQLVAAYPGLPNDEVNNPNSLAAYVATKIFSALSTMFRGAHDIQFWLGECASRISTCLTAEQLTRLESEWPRLVSEKAGKGPLTKATGARYTPATLESLTQFKSSVIWTTPLHMPVVQPYRSSKSKIIATNMQKINLSEPHRSDPVNKRKQLQGFPPNFIHSLDATHMLLSALECDKHGLSFAAVHDSFWTHASDVDKMNTALRECFIKIHSEDVVGRLRDEFIARYQGAMRVANLKVNTAAYREISLWRSSKERDFGRNRRVPKTTRAPFLDELRMERERMRLLASDDPLEVEKGKKMVTPTSIFLQHSAEQDLITDDDLGAAGLGDISTRQARLSAEEDESSDAEENIVGENMGSAEASSKVIDEEDLLRDPEADEPAAMDDATDFKKTSFEKRLTKVASRVPKSTQIWLPLTFPPVPQKGEFDVFRLMDSQYFFS
ncbi:hypothetical protein LZ554_003320 [Drepanopeziza brunnea f. sp. 'monogermtubi']|nr:hypothetical protein LZ554_003320 [Drepanopeziza brunnea f. sp. 'monogermtubi']